MNKIYLFLRFQIIVVISFCLILVYSEQLVFASNAIKKIQSSNTISGYVFGIERKPISNLDVELLDDYSRSVARTRTTSSGRYEFTRIPAGKYRVKVLTYSVDYQEQSQEIEIINITRQTSSGSIVRSGMENFQQDFYLKPKKTPANTINEIIFAQDVPKQAKDKFDLAVSKISSNKLEEGLIDLKSAIEMFPDYFAALELLGSEYIKLKYYEAAQILLSKAIEVNPKSYRSWYGIAYASYSLNQFPSAMDAIKKSISLNGDVANSLLLYGILLKQDKNYNEALTQFKKANSISDSAIPEIHWQLSLLYINNFKLYKEGIDELELYLKFQTEKKDIENIKTLIKKLKEKI